MQTRCATIAAAALVLPFNTGCVYLSSDSWGLGRMRILAIVMAFALAGCSMGGFNAERNNFKGKPLSAVTAMLGPPQIQETFGGQKSYTWSAGQPPILCHIRVIMAGDVVDTYETSGEPASCYAYESRQIVRGDETIAR